MIKSKDKISIPDRRDASCFAEGETASGIAFERSDGTKRFASHSFLASVDFDGANTLIFRYTFGTITVQGEALEPLWNAVCRGSLVRVTERTGGRSGEDLTLIRAITIEADDDGPQTPAFPSQS